MRDRLYPNESREYREARDLLLEEEYAIVDKTRAVAAMRRNLPRGGELKEDYVCPWAKDGKVGERVRFSELFRSEAHTSELQSLMRISYAVCCLKSTTITTAKTTIIIQTN